jgi:hypothetical protein
MIIMQQQQPAGAGAALCGVCVFRLPFFGRACAARASFRSNS